jgi:hypothetical protein
MNRESLPGSAGKGIDGGHHASLAAFKGWLRQISQRVAEASKEGGFLASAASR